jgi:hypothetical protein
MMLVRAFLSYFFTINFVTFRDIWLLRARLLFLRPTPKLEKHPLSAIHYLPYVEAVSSIRNLMTVRTVVRGNPLVMNVKITSYLNKLL